MRPANDMSAYRQFFALHKNLAYQIAYTYTQDEESAESVVEQAMRQMRISGFLDAPELSREDRRGLLMLITRHRALVAARESRNGASAPREVEGPKPTMAGDAEVSIFGEIISKIPTRDRIVLIMAAVYRLSDSTIARALRLKSAAVTRRRLRSLQFIADQWGHHQDNPEALLEESSLLTALTLWLKGRINSAEAMSNMDPHAYSPETEERIVKAMADPQRELSFRALEESGNRIPLMAGLLVLVVVLGIVIAQAFRTNDRPSVVALDSDLVSGEVQSGLESEVSEEAVTETRTIPLAHVAALPDAIVFYDAQEGKVYRAQNEQDAEEILDIAQTVQESYGLQHIGEAEGVIYLAFIDGRGGRIDGAPAQLTVEPYWQESWFEDNRAVNETTHVRRGSIAYVFKNVETTEE